MPEIQGFLVQNAADGRILLDRGEHFGRISARNIRRIQNLARLHADSGGQRISTFTAQLSPGEVAVLAELLEADAYHIPHAELGSVTKSILRAANAGRAEGVREDVPLAGSPAGRSYRLRHFVARHNAAKPLNPLLRRLKHV
jgi:hypothetical protein